MPEIQCDLEGCVHNNAGFCDHEGTVEWTNDGSCLTRNVPENKCPYCGYPSVEGLCTECKSLVR
jgi:hypothetical protein